MSSILIWVSLAFVALAAAAALLTRKVFHVETVVTAPPEKVWRILMDTGGYRDWNPVFVDVDGAYVEGQAVTNTVRFPDGSDVKMKAKVRTLVDARELRQFGGTPGVLTFDHRWLVEPVEGGTRVIQHEVDRGIWLWFWNSDWIEPSYGRVLEALRQRLEEPS